MISKAIFPTTLHQHTAKLVRDYFLTISAIDTVLVVNSCARGQATPESDLDFAILLKPNTSPTQIKQIETAWQTYAQTQATLLKYKQSSPFAHLHLDLIEGNYTPQILEMGGMIDYFEVEVGNHICYSAPMSQPGLYFQELQHKWLPYYNEELRLQRLTMVQKACEYDLEHIPFFIKRGLYFHAFNTLCKAFQEYLQVLFIAHKTYPIAYNKWIREQVVKWLNKPELYALLAPILSINNIQSNDLNDKTKMLGELLENIRVC